MRAGPWAGTAIATVPIRLASSISIAMVGGTAQRCPGGVASSGRIVLCRIIWWGRHVSGGEEEIESRNGLLTEGEEGKR
jgi:hypothetical protein